MSENNINDKLISKILNTVRDKSELKNCINTLNFHMSITLHKCISQSLELRSIISDITMLETESILDYIDDLINIGHWSKVPVETRRAYTVASFVKMVISLKFHQESITINLLREVLRYIDKGLLLGAPLRNNSEMLTKSATIISIYISQNFETNISNIGDNKIIVEPKEHSYYHFQYLFDNIKAEEIDTMVLPSVEQFNNMHFTNQQPVKLQGCIDHWPARTKWKNIDYILKTAGDRTVPVEIGTQYIDENWSQKLMTIREFIEKYYATEEFSIGYLAQHNLFDQIPELRSDIYIPEYCSLSRDYDNSCDPDINCWFGPAGTVSSLHYDPKNNILAQVYGIKQVLLFAPHDTQNLYPYEGELLSNTSQVDPMIPNLELYPNVTKARMYKCLLAEGEILFIPAKWWHHVTALEKSFSVSFWWQ